MQATSRGNEGSRWRGRRVGWQAGWRNAAAATVIGLLAVAAHAGAPDTGAGIDSAALTAALPVGTPPYLTALEGLSAAEQGRVIWEAKDRIESGYGDLQVTLEMVLRDRRGTESRRALSISQLEMPEDGDRLLVVFDTPKQIRGTALLSYSYVSGPDDQWLYLPAVKRVKRIASQNKSGPFLSSEFAFEDMVLQELEKFEYRLLGRETCGARACYRVERRPLDRYSGYSRQEVLLDSATLRVEQVDYFDRAERPLKILRVSEYQLFDGQFWKPGRMSMENLQTGKSTEILWHDYRFATGLSAERDFTTNSLARAR